MKFSLSLLLAVEAVSSMLHQVPASEYQCSNLDCSYRLIERIVAFEHKNAEMERKLVALERKNEELAVTVNDQQYKLDKVPVHSVPMNWTRSSTAFTATIVPDPYTVPSSGRIIFDKNITNVNNNYNPTDGLFRAPVRGIYFFSVMVRHYDKGYIHPTLKKNDEVVARMASGDRTDWDGSSSISVVLELNVNDVLCVDGEANEEIQGYRSYFTGFLLHSIGF